MTKWVYLLGISILLGYGPNLAPYYVLLFYPNELRVLGPVTNFEEPCKEKAGPTSYCAHRYIIPSQVLQKFPSGSLGTGQILSATIYSCTDLTRGHPAQFDDPQHPGRLLQTLKTYQMVELEPLNCGQSDVQITSWSIHGARRTGYAGGLAVVGSTRAVERVKTVSEFFSIGLIQLLGYFFVALFFFSQMLAQILGSSLKSTPFERYISAWFGFILTTSGLLQIMLPITQFANLFDRIGCFFSLLCRSSVLFVFISDHAMAKGRLKKFSSFLLSPVASRIPVPRLSILTAAIAFSPDFVEYFGPSMAFFACCTLLIALFYKDAAVLCFSVAFLLESLKILGLPFLPQSQIATMYVGFVLAIEIVRRFEAGVKLSKLAKQFNRPVEQKAINFRFNESMQILSEHIPCNQLALLSVRKEGGCRIRTLSKTKQGELSFNSFDREELPPMFAHAISAGRSVIHLDDRSDQALNIRRGAPPSRAYESHFQCIFPFFGDSQAIGGLAFTEYPDEWAADIEKTLEIETSIRLIQPALMELILSESLQNSSHWSETVRTVTAQLYRLRQGMNEIGVSNEALIFENCISSICSNLKTYGYIAKLDHESRLFEIKAILGYPDRLQKILVEGKLYALRENEQGPLALAVNRRKTIFAPDVKLLRKVLHENTNIFFDWAGTKTCVAVPIKKELSDDIFFADDSSIWGVLFLERNHDDPFTLQSVMGLEQIASAISSLLVDIENSQKFSRTQNILSSFVPAHVFSQVIDGGMEKEIDHGFMVKIDLRGSSKIALDVGTDRWARTTDELLPKIEKLANLRNLKIQQFEWDAAWLTLSSNLPDAEKLDNILDFCKDTIPLIDAWYETHFDELAKGFFGNDNRRARYCISFGDTTRGFTGGPTKRWTVIGSEMGVINKFEDQCKLLDAVIYADSSIAGLFDSKHWKNTRQRIPSSSREIYKYDATWDWLLAATKKAA